MKRGTPMLLNEILKEHGNCKNVFLRGTRRGRRIFGACASVGALESGFTVEPCATIKSAESFWKSVMQNDS